MPRKLGCATKLAAAALLLSQVVAAAAGDTWDDVGPGRIGERRQDIAAAGLQCNEQEQTSIACTLPAARFAGVPVTHVELRFLHGTLVRVTVHLAEREYAALLARLRARLGEPEDRSYRARAGMAGEFDAGVKLWTQGEVALVLEQFAGKISRSGLTFGDAQAMAPLLAEKRSYPSGALRDL
jgi:hypothetical protein